MNGKRATVLTLALTAIVFAGQLFSQQEVQSLRGMNAIEENAPIPESKRWKPDSRPLNRDFIQQPPLIPHSTTGYQINLKFNKCLTCHSWANTEESGATKISPTHFRDRDGTELANVSPTRYFCTQCHVAQRDVSPLVENVFEPVKVLQ